MKLEQVQEPKPFAEELWTRVQAVRPVQGGIVLPASLPLNSAMFRDCQLK